MPPSSTIILVFVFISAFNVASASQQSWNFTCVRIGSIEIPCSVVRTNGPCHALKHRTVTIGDRLHIHPLGRFSPDFQLVWQDSRLQDYQVQFSRFDEASGSHEASLCIAITTAKDYLERVTTEENNSNLPIKYHLNLTEELLSSPANITWKIDTSPAGDNGPTFNVYFANGDNRGKPVRDRRTRAEAHVLCSGQIVVRLTDRRAYDGDYDDPQEYRLDLMYFNKLGDKAHRWNFSATEAYTERKNDWEELLSFPKQHKFFRVLIKADPLERPSPCFDTYKLVYVCRLTPILGIDVYSTDCANSIEPDPDKSTVTTSLEQVSPSSNAEPKPSSTLPNNIAGNNPRVGPVATSTEPTRILGLKQLDFAIGAGLIVLVVNIMVLGFAVRRFCRKQTDIIRTIDGPRMYDRQMTGSLDSVKSIDSGRSLLPWPFRKRAPKMSPELKEAKERRWEWLKQSNRRELEKQV